MRATTTCRVMGECKRRILSCMMRKTTLSHFEQITHHSAGYSLILRARSTNTPCDVLDSLRSISQIHLKVSARALLRTQIRLDIRRRCVYCILKAKDQRSKTRLHGRKHLSITGAIFSCRVYTSGKMHCMGACCEAFSP